MTKTELESMTKDELVAYADDNDIDVHHSMLKDEMIATILKAEKKMAKQEAKPAAAPASAPAAAAEQEVNPETGVSPELEELQKQANQPVDDSTRFAAKPSKTQMDTY